MNKAVLLLGSNLGNKKNNIETALIAINQKIGRIIKKSDLAETLPEDYKSKNNYFNLGIIVHTALSPIHLLKILKEIEHEIGRTKDSSNSGRYEDRTIDIDIVYYNRLNFISKKLIIPHLLHAEKRSFSKKILHQLT